jgi:vacuolar iron transporter family protein
MDKEVRQYLSSIVLGLNDALVELTGALAGLTLAFQNSNIILVSGFIVGFAASLSMAGSEYLSTKAELIRRRSPIRAASYTGFAYLLTVLLLLFPYLILSNVYYALLWALINAVIIIGWFTYYTSMDRKGTFRKKFIEMLIISLGVAALSFGVGYLLKMWVGVEI